MTCARTSAFTNPSSVPIHSPKIGTSFCSTCTTSTSGEAPGGAPDTCFGRIAPIIRPMTIKQSAPPIQSLYFERVFIFVSSVASHHIAMGANRRAQIPTELD